MQSSLMEGGSQTRGYVWDFGKCFKQSPVARPDKESIIGHEKSQIFKKTFPKVVRAEGVFKYIELS